MAHKAGRNKTTVPVKQALPVLLQLQRQRGRLAAGPKSRRCGALLALARCVLQACAEGRAGMAQQAGSSERPAKPLDERPTVAT